MIIKHDKKGIQLHFPHWQFYVLVGILTVSLCVAGFVGYQYYKSNFFDSSINGSEASEINQQTIPPDVKKTLTQQKIITPTEVPIHMPQSAPIPIPILQVRVPILMYHYIEYVKDKNDKTRISLSTTPFVLEQEVKTLSDAGYTFMTNSELADVLDGKIPLPQKPILLTFDDGYRDFYTDAYPILKKYHAKATQYVIAGFLDRPNHLLTSQLQEIAADRLVEIGAHTVHHLWLKGQSLKTVSNEVFQSKEIIEKKISLPVVSFAYPFGAFDEQAVKVVKDAGFRSSVSTIPGVEQIQQQRFFLYRLRPGGRSGQYLLDWLEHQNQ